VAAAISFQHGFWPRTRSPVLMKMEKRKYYVAEFKTVYEKEQF